VENSETKLEFYRKQRYLVASSVDFIESKGLILKWQNTKITGCKVGSNRGG
jgi:hypothetical protein